MANVRVTRSRHVRHRKFQGLRRGGGFSRLSKLNAWCESRATALGGTGTGTPTSAVDFANDELDFAGPHPFAGGDVVRLNTAGTIPTGLAEATDYQVVEVDTDSISVKSPGGQFPTGISDAGTGAVTVTPATDRLSMAEWLRARAPEAIQAAADIDNL